MKTFAGYDMQAAQMGGDTIGKSGTSTSNPAATTLTDTGGAFGANGYTGHMVVIVSQVTPFAAFFGTIVSHTSTVLTVGRWNAAATPGGTAGSPAAQLHSYLILPGNAPAMYMALSTDTATVTTADTTLPSEITTAGGGLIRKICPYAHTASASTYTLTPVFTVNGSDTGLPVTIAKIGTFQTVHNAMSALFQTLLVTGGGATAVLSAVGDQLTITQTVTM